MPEKEVVNSWPHWKSSERFLSEVEARVQDGERSPKGHNPENTSVVLDPEVSDWVRRRVNRASQVDFPSGLGFRVWGLVCGGGA